MDNQNQDTNVIFSDDNTNPAQGSVGFGQSLTQAQSLDPSIMTNEQIQPMAPTTVPPVKRENIFIRLVKRADVVLALLLVLGSLGLFISAYLSDNKTPSSANAANQYDTTQLPLSDFVTSEGVNFGTQSVIVNGSLQANNGLIIAPSLQPTSATAGEMYYDQTSNILSYYNGTQFVPLSGAVQSVGGLTGQVNVGTGLSAAGEQLSNTGVLSVQGLTGDVTLDAGTGIAINGSTISNTGIISVTSGSSSLTVSNDGNGNITLNSATSGVSSPGGTNGNIPVFTGAQTIADSIITQSGTTLTVAGDLALSSPLTVSNGGTGATSLALNGVLVGQGTGSITSVAAGGAGFCLVSTAGAPTWAACPGSGGVSSLNGLTGALSIANATGAGSTVTIDNASTSAKGVAQFNATNFSVGSGIVNTVQNINTGATPTFAGVNTNSITPSAALTLGSTSQSLTLQGNGSTSITATSGANTTTVAFTAPTANTTLNFPASSAGTYTICTTSGNCLGGGGGANTALSNLASVAINTTLLPGSAGAINLGSATLPFGDLFLAGTSGTPGTNNFRITGASTGGTRTITIPDASGTVCLTTGNCAGSGGGVTTAGGTTGTLPVFTGSQAIGDSLLSQSGGVVTAAGNFNLTTGSQYRINSVQISSADLSNDANLAKLNATQTFTGTTNAFQNGANTTNAFNVQNAAGTRILTVDTTNGEVELGVGSTLNGTLVFNNSSNTNAITIVPGTPSAARTITLPDASGIVCLTSGNCSGVGAGDVLQGGNSFATTMTIGTNDAFDLNLETSGVTRLTVESDGSQVTFASNVDLIMQGATAYISNPQGHTGGEFFGLNTSGTGADMTVVGNGASAGDGAVAIGAGTSGGATDSTAIGTAASAGFTGSVALGVGATTTAINQAVLGSTSQAITRFVIGEGVADGTPIGTLIQTTSGSGTNIAGADLSIAAGQGTGSANGGGLNFQVSAPGSSGTATNALSTVATLSGAAGAATFQNAVNTTQAFVVKDASGANMFVVDTSNARAGFNLGGSSVPSLASNGLEVKGAIRISGTTSIYDNYTTPDGATVSARLSVVNATVGAAQQIIAVGVTSASNSTARGIVVLDDRASAHQPSIAVISPNESQIGGFSWEGSDSSLYIKNSEITGAVIVNLGGTDEFAVLSDRISAQGDFVPGTGSVYKLGRIGQEFDQLFLGNDQGVTFGVAQSANLAYDGVTDNRIELTGANSTLYVEDGLVLGAVGTTDTATYLCRNSTNQISLCNTTGSGATFSQGGNSFGATAVLGTNDSNSLTFETNNATQATIAVGGATTFQNQTDSTAAFRILNSSGAGSVPQFVVDTSNSRVYIGDPTPDTTGALLVLDTKNNAGDPTGVDGAMYFNSSYARMRCYFDGQWRYCNDPQSLSLGYNIDDDFVANFTEKVGERGWTSASSGTGAGTVPQVSETSRPGILQIDAGTDTSGYATIYLNSNGGKLAPVSGGEEIEFAINLPTLADGTNDYDARAGLCSNSNGTDCDDGIYIEYDRDSSTNWRIATASGGTRTKNNSSTAVTTGWHRFKIVVNSAATSIQFYLDGSALGSAITTNIPTATSQPEFTIIKDTTTGAASRVMNADYFQFRRSLTTAR